MGGRGGGGQGSKSFQAFLPKYQEFWALKKLSYGCPKWADTIVTLKCPKRRGGGLRPLLDNVQKKDAFSDVFPKTL